MLAGGCAEHRIPERQLVCDDRAMVSRRVASSAEATSNNSIQSRTIARAIEASSFPFLVVTWKNSASA